MRKKLVGLLSLLFCFAILLPMPVFADIGPKPSVQLTFEGIEETPYYVTLLSKDKSTGPYTWRGNYRYFGDDFSMERLYGQTVQQAFRDYQDEDSFYYVEYAENCSTNNSFCWRYFPPSTFKVLIYFPESGQFVSSGIYERYAFDSYFTVTATADGHLTLRKSYDYTWEVLSLLARMAATVVLEILIALLFGYRKKKTLAVIAVTNLLTQGVLNLLLNFFNYQRGSWAFVFHYIWMELVVTIMEAVLFSILFPKIGESSGKRPVGYAITANILSFIAGMVLAHIIPGIF